MNRLPIGLALVLAISCGAPDTRGNVEPFTERDAARHARLQELFWLAQLSDEQIAFVADTLDDSNTRVLEAAIDNVFLHRLDGLAPKLEAGVGRPSMHVRILGQMCAEAIGDGKDPSAELRSALGTELPGDDMIPERDRLRDFRPLRDLLTNLIVLEEVRAVRRGEKDRPSVEGLELSSGNAELVAWSEQEDETAIARIVQDLSTAKVAGDREYTMMQALQNYPPGDYLPVVVEALAAQADEDSYGTLLLLRTLRFRCASLDAQSRATLANSLKMIAGQEAKPSIKTVAGALETELSEIDEKP